MDEDQPGSTEGTSLENIYSFMQHKGNYTNFLRLIDDLDQTEVLSKTGSRTIFVANDDAFTAFFRSNKWGVHSYAELSEAQKKLILNSSMLGNSYSPSMLSTGSTDNDPVKGTVVRRASQLDILDSVQVITDRSELPESDSWTTLFDSKASDSLLLFKDESGAPQIVHITPRFVAVKGFTSDDVDFLYNQPAGTRAQDMANGGTGIYVNDARVLSSTSCMNGYVFEMDRVLTPLDNMAEIIRKNPRVSEFSKIVERFAAPAYSATLSTRYKALHPGTAIDSVFVKRYYSDRSYGSTFESSISFAADIYNNPFDASLKFDPGWNRYLPLANKKLSDGTMENMSVMFVPTDAAIREWWSNGGGAVIRDEYGTLDNTPNSVLQELVNVNMQSSFVSTVPTFFSLIKDDAGVYLGITKDDVDSVLIGCNGAVYLTNKVFAPSSYSSVLFPAIINTRELSSTRNLVDRRSYKAYLNSMVSHYLFFIPTNDALLTWVDPISFGGLTNASPKIWEMEMNPDKALQQRITVYIYDAQLNDDGTWEKTGSPKTYNPWNTNAKSGSASDDPGRYDKDAFWLRMEDMLDNLIVIDTLQSGKHYYQTKANTFIRLGSDNFDQQGMKVYGSWQDDRTASSGNDMGASVVMTPYHLNNGNSYIIDQPVMTSVKSVLDVLSDHDEYSMFAQLVANSDIAATSSGPSAKYTSVSNRGNLVTMSTTGTTYPLLNAYHYTVYAPTNTAIENAIASGEMPDLIQMLHAAEEADSIYTDEQKLSTPSTIEADKVKQVMRDFIKYHVQTNSLYLDEGFKAGNYETMMTNFTVQGDTTVLITSSNKNAYPGYNVGDVVEGKAVVANSPHRLRVQSVSPTALVVVDALGNTHTVSRQDGLFNLQGREYWYEQKSKTALEENELSNASSFVIQPLDKPLFFDKDQFTFVQRFIVDLSNLVKRRNR